MESRVTRPNFNGEAEDAVKLPLSNPAAGIVKATRPIPSVFIKSLRLYFSLMSGIIPNEYDKNGANYSLLRFTQQKSRISTHVVRTKCGSLRKPLVDRRCQLGERILIDQSRAFISGKGQMTTAG